MSEQSIYSGRRFRTALGAFLSGRIVQGAASLLLTLWVVRLLDSVDYGVYMALWGMAEALVPLSSLGLLDAVRRFLPELAVRGAGVSVRGFVKWVTIVRVGILLVGCGGIALAWDVLTNWMGFSAIQTTQTWQAVIMALSMVAFRFACEMLECLLEQRWSQSVRALHPIGRLVCVAALFLSDKVSLSSLLWVDVAVSLTCLLLAELALSKRLGCLSNAGDYRLTLREVISFAWHMAGVNLLQAISSSGVQRLLVVRFLGLEIAGLFSFLQQLVSIVSRYMPAQLMANIIRPMLISRLVAGESGIVAQAMALMWKSNLMIVCASVTSLAVAGDVLVGSLSSWRFSEAGLSALLIFIGLGAVSQGLIINMAMQIHDKSRALRQQSFLFILQPILVWTGTAYGLLGAIGGVVLAQWCRNLVAMWWMRRQGIGIDLDIAGIMRTLVISIFVAGVGLLLVEVSGPWIALAVTLFLLAMGLLIVRPLCNSDLALLLIVFKGKERFLKQLVRPTQ